MEKEAVLEECVSLEMQLSSLRTQIKGLISDVEEQRAKVILLLNLNSLYWYKFVMHACLLQVSSTKMIHDQAQSELNLIREKMKECDSQISCILKNQQRLQNKLSETNLERKKMENEVIYNCYLHVFLKVL